MIEIKSRSLIDPVYGPQNGQGLHGVLLKKIENEKLLFLLELRFFIPLLLVLNCTT